MVIIIILLVLCLPLILMLCLFTTTNMVSIAVDVPVSGIEVAIEEIVELDFDKGETFAVDYSISPIEATNKNIAFLFEEVTNQKLATFRVEGNVLIPTSTGWARVIVETADGAFRDSFIVYVKSKGVTNIVATPNRAEITVGETTGIDTKFTPVTAGNKTLSYRVIEGEQFATVDESGNIRGIGIGKAKVEVTSLDNPNAKSVVEISVKSSGVFDFVTSGKTHTSLQNPHGEFKAVINPDITLAKDPEFTVLDADGNPLDSVLTYSYDRNTGILSYEIIDRTYIGRIEILMTVTPEGADPVTKSVTVTQVSEITAAWTEDQENLNDGSAVVGSEPVKIGIDLNPLGADVRFEAVIEYQTASGETVTETVTLTNGTAYTPTGGYVSLKIVNSDDGAYLELTNVAENPDFQETKIKLTVIDNNDESTRIDLDEITVGVF